MKTPSALPASQALLSSHTHLGFQAPASEGTLPMPVARWQPRPTDLCEPVAVDMNPLASDTSQFSSLMQP